MWVVVVVLWVGGGVNGDGCGGNGEDSGWQ